MHSAAIKICSCNSRIVAAPASGSRYNCWIIEQTASYSRYNSWIVTTIASDSRSLWQQPPTVFDAILEFWQQPPTIVDAIFEFWQQPLQAFRVRGLQRPDPARINRLIGELEVLVHLAACLPLASLMGLSAYGSGELQEETSNWPRLLNLKPDYAYVDIGDIGSFKLQTGSESYFHYRQMKYYI